MKRFYPINAGNNRFVTKKNEKNKRNEEKNDVFGHQAHNVFFYKLRHCTTQNAYCCSKIGDSDLHPVIRFLNNRMARSEPFYHAGMGFSCLIVIDAHQQQVVPGQQGGDGLFPDFPSVIGIGGRGDTFPDGF